MQGQTSATAWAAFVRSMGAVVLAAVGAGFTAYLSVDGIPLATRADVWEAVVLAAVGGALGALGWRGGAEGAYDVWRQRRGGQTPADVSPPPPEPAPMPPA